MNSKRQKSQSLHSSSRGKSRGIDPKILKIYGANKKTQPNNKNMTKSKRSTKANPPKRKDTETYDFPQFSISFTPPPNNHVINPKSHTIINPIKCRQKSQEPSEQQREVPPNILNKDLMIRKQYYPDFILALSKLFKTLDLFNRGTINEMNLNHRISQFVMKFLEKVFRKIREDRLTITQREFIKMCEPILKEANIDDLLTFLKTFSPSQNNLKISINLNQNSEVPLSPIKQRMIQEQSSSSKKNNHLDEVLCMIGVKEKLINEKLKDVKDRKKTVSFNVLGEITNNGSINTSNSKVSKSILQASMRKQVTFDEMQNIYTKNDIKPNVHFQPEQNQSENTQQYFVPNFAYKLPSSKPMNRRMIEPSVNNAPSNIKELLQSKGISSTSFHETYDESNPISMRFLQNSNYSYMRQSNSETKRYEKHEQDDKINRLNSKLQQYLKRSQSKIQKSKIFMLENSSLSLLDR